MSARSSLSSRRATSATALSVAALLLLTGCFSGGSSGDGSTDERVELAMLQPPRSGLSPLSDDAFKLSRWSTAETLIRLDEEGNAEPMLATEWEQVDDTTWSFTLRDGVTFHDGTEMTTENVVESLTHAVEAEPAPRILDGVEMTVTADGDKVLVTTAEEDPLVPQRLSSPQLSVLAPAAYEGDAVTPVGHGTGPFELTAVDGTSGATLERYEDYWGDPATSAGIDVSFVPDGTARAAALRTGEADVVEAVPVGQAAQVDEELLEEVPMPRTNTLYLNTEKGPFADAGLRAAAREAIDPQSIVDGVYESRADVASGLLGPAIPYAAEGRDTDTYRELLDGRAEAGDPQGQKITIGTFTDRAELPEVAVQLQQQLEAAGFEVELEVREYQYIESDAIDGDFDAFILSRATVLDSGDPVAYMVSDFGCEGSFNISQFCSETVEAALDRAEGATPGEERQEAILEAEATILAEDAAIPMLHERVIQGEQDGVEGAARDPRERELITAQTTLAR
ncbi:ABC transporter substrate-binding protein [Kocuria coralli]|uniref:ABC transporter substrate-binding protein n=1 Tax=Kocuria coralli TaxID=1461025 RepID=A0A5J5KYR4_9MICC|nr:ABC transporter substrate-binding protein [Kocuria coralli]KAA9394897.1 ABC transporter substrate-binding protein [Kocuria coralli]